MAGVLAGCYRLNGTAVCEWHPRSMMYDVPKGRGTPAAPPSLKPYYRAPQAHTPAAIRRPRMPARQETCTQMSAYHPTPPGHISRRILRRSAIRRFNVCQGCSKPRARQFGQNQWPKYPPKTRGIITEIAGKYARTRIVTSMAMMNGIIGRNNCRISTFAIADTTKQAVPIGGVTSEIPKMASEKIAK